MTKSIWEEKNIPQLEFCNLKRASELLDCKISDLLHWSEIGAIQLCLIFDNFDVALYKNSWGNRINRPEMLSKIIEEVHAQIIAFDGDISTDRHPLSHALIDIRLPGPGKEPLAPEVELSWNDECDYFVANTPLGSISGLWIIPRRYQDWESQLISNGSAGINNVGAIFLPADCDEFEPDYKAYPPGEALITSWDKTELFRFTTDDVYITKKQINTLFEYKGQALPSFINGMKNRPESEEAPPEEPQVRVTMRQSTMIVALLSALGITEDDMRGSTSQMETKLKNIASKMNVAIPDIDQKTWREWLSREGKR